MQEQPGAAVDLTNCDREPIHLIGSVQSFGFLIAVSNSDWVVTRVSANVRQWTGREPTEVLGLPIQRVFTEASVHAIRGHLHSAIMGDTVARAFNIALFENGSSFDVAVHVSGDSVVIECEPSIDEPALNTGVLVRGMVARLQQTNDQRAFFRVAAREMRALTGFDRVMIYRFDSDGSGEVIAESARAGLETYLGLHYPASDIPQQARRLYQKNWLRIIPDIATTPSPIGPTLDVKGQPLDLSMSVLRSVSPIHIEYLKNMGVAASMSISILGPNRLWGLFACHHYAPHHVPFGRRTAAELFGQMFSLLMENRERESEAEYEGRAQKLHQQLVTVMASETTRFESIVGHLDDIGDLLTCDGIGVYIDQRATLKGLTPNEEQFGALISYLQSKQISDIYARHHIGDELPQGREFEDRAAGMLVVPLSRPARDYLIFFRKELARSVNWAGDPTKPVAVGPLGARLTPRKSFELWKETVSGQSQQWSAVECRIAEALRVSLLEVILRLSSLTESERKRAQERQELLIAELNHRVRNILSLIRGVINQSRDSSATLESFSQVVGGRIQALARAHDQITADNWGPASLRALINAEAGAYLGGKAGRIAITGPDILLEPQAFTTVALVVHEMITNSAKYGALTDARGKVHIETKVDGLGKLLVNWTEQGGPPVQPPIRRGFGSTIIERSIPHDLKGEAEIKYALAGVSARFVIPADYVRAPIHHANEEAKANSAPATLSAPPADVLLVEDNLIIALDTEEALQKLGVGTVRIVGNVTEALKAIDASAPEFALLDVNLGAETSFEVAEILLERGVPFAFATGYGEQIAFPESFAGTPRIRKPYTADTLAAMLGTLVK
jgi:light-regulated signal transduction histidine kinase (bacteriophytochrome)